MNIETFTLVDHASDDHGKLTTIGAFDTLYAPQFPSHHPHCCVALRMRFQRSEEGKHTVRILLVDGDGRPHGFKFEAQKEVKVPADAESGCANLVIMLNGLPLKNPGNYYWDLVVDGQLVSRLPMFVRQVKQQQAAA